MPQPKRKPAIQPSVPQDEFLRMLGAEVPTGAPAGTAAPMAGLTPEDYIALGIDPNTLEGGRNMFETFIPGSDLAAFEEWKARNAPNDSGEDYDLRGAFANGEQPAANGHWSDKYKKPNHPTFSDESIYANMPGADPGHWTGSRHDQFVPGAFAKAEDALADNTVEHYMQGVGDAFMHGTKQIAKGYDQALNGVDLNTAMGGASEALRNDIGSASGDLRKHDNSALNAAMNIGNGFVAAAYSPIAPVFHPLIEEGVDQFSRGPAGDPDTQGRNFIQRNMLDPASDALGVSPDALTETALNVAMFGHEIPGAYRGAVRAGHRGMDALEDGLFRDYKELFPEYRDEKNRTTLGLADRVGNATLEAFGTDPAAPGYAAPWVKPGIDEAGREIRPLSRMLPDMVDRIPALDNVPLPSWLREAPRAQGELSPWLQANHETSSVTPELRSYIEQQGWAPGLVDEMPEFTLKRFAEQMDRDNRPSGPKTGRSLSGSNGGNIKRPSSDRQALRDALVSNEGTRGELSPVPEAGDWVPEEGGVNAAYSQLVNQDWGGLPDAATRIREQQSRYDAERAQAPRTTLDQVPSINSNQGENGSVFDPNSSSFFSNLMREADRRDANPVQDAPSGISLDRWVEMTPEQRTAYRDMTWNGEPDTWNMDDHVDTANRNLAAMNAPRPNTFRPGDDVDQAHWSGVADRQRPNTDTPDWDAAGIAPDDPARQAYERARAGQMRNEARDAARSRMGINGQMQPSWEAPSSTRFFNEDGSMAGARLPDDAETLADYNARQIARQDARAGLPDLSQLDHYQRGRSDEYNRNDNVFGNYDMTRAPDENSPYANAPARQDLTDPEDIARYDYLRMTTDPWAERRFARAHGGREGLSPQGQRDFDIAQEAEMNSQSLNSLENRSDNKARDVRYNRLAERDRQARRKVREQGAARRAALGDKVRAEPVYDGKNTVTFGDGGKLVRTSGESGDLQIGGTRSQTFEFSHPDLPQDIEIELDTLRSGKTITTIMGDADTNAGVLGHTIIRNVARALKKHFSTNNYEGVRATGIRGGKGLTQRTRFANGFSKPSAVRKDALQDEFGNPLSPDASVRDTATAAIRGSGKPKQPGEITTLPDGSTFEHITDIVYSRDQGLRRAVMEYKKPGMKNSVEVMLTVSPDGAGHIDILGDNDHIGAFGNKNVREAARWLRQEYGVTKFEGWRTKRSDWAEDKQMQSLPATRFANGGGEKPSVTRQRELDQKGEEPAGFETPDVEGGTVREAALQALRDQRLAKMDKKARKGINPKRLAAADESAMLAPQPLAAPTGGKGRGNQGARSGIMATPNLRDLSPEEAMKTVAREPHLIQDNTGQFIGAPRGIKSRKQILALRKRFDAEVEKGLAGAQWYGRAREANTRNNSGAMRQSLAAKEQALMSAQAAPDPNMNWGLNLRNDYEAGVPASKMRTGRQAETYLRARTEGAHGEGIGHNSSDRLQDMLGKKTGIYGEHLDPNVPFATTGTNDIWHARSWGYKNNDGKEFSRALTAQEHRWLDYETVLAAKRANERKMGGRSNWTAAEIQAAPWVAMKGASLAKKSKGRMTEEQGIAAAGKTYPDFEDKYTANVTRENWPSQGMQMFPEWDMANATAAEREAWDAAHFNYDEGGRHPTYSQDFGMSVRPTQRSVGSFEGQNNPVDVARPLVHLEQEGGKPTVGKSAKNMLDIESAASGMRDFQDGSAWHKIISHGPGSDKSSLSINLGRTPNLQEMQALEAIASKYGFGLANASDGVSFLDFNGLKTNDVRSKLGKGGMRKEIEEAVGPANINLGRFEGGYHDLSAELKPENQGQGLATKKTMAAIDAAGKDAPAARHALLHSKAEQAKAAQKLKLILETEKVRGPAREDVKKFLDILARGGWKGLYNYVNKMGTKGLPAVALPLLLQQGAGKKNEGQTVDMSAY